MPWTPDETGLEDDRPSAEWWLCQAGHVHETYHCPFTGEEPPWRCPCSICSEDEGEDTRHEP